MSENKPGGPLVSAIITTHNREPQLVLRAVRSVLAQTYRNMELIVVDDSPPSFARRAEVEQAVRSLSEDVLYLKHETCRGACAARNTGLGRARGTFVGFLDDDDEWMPEKAEEQLKGFTDENTALVYSQVIYVNEENHTEKPGSPRSFSGYVFDELLRFNFIGSTSGPLLRKACVDAVGGFDEQMASCQDYDLWLRLAMKYPIQLVNLPLLRVHFHAGRRISSDDEKRVKGIERILSKYAEYFSADYEAWYSRGSMLLPHYLKVYGRKKALGLWFTCVKKCPGKIPDNLGLLKMILSGK